MRRRPLALATAALITAVTGLTGCSAEDRPPDADIQAACAEYTRLVNQWSVSYGAEMGAVGQAGAVGDRGRQETAVPVVRELFQTTADNLREQAGRTADQDLADALTEAAEGLVEIADQIETYEDVTAAPELMSSGRFAAGGARVSEICAP